MERLELFVIKYWRSLLKLTVAMLIFVLILSESGKVLSRIDFAKTFRLLRHIEYQTIVILFFGGVAATFVMVAYDFVALKWFNHKMGKFQWISYSFVANALNNLLGMGGLAGAAVRVALMKKSSETNGSTLYYNVVLAPATPTGLSFLAIYLLTAGSITKVIANHYNWLYLGLFAMIAYLPFYLWSHKLIDKFQKQSDDREIHRRWTLKLLLIGVSLAEWVSAALFLYFILKCLKVDISLAQVLAVYSLGAIAGIMSFVPAGIGSFDLMALVGFNAYGVSSELALGALLLFRVFYYIMPSTVGMVMFLFSAGLDLRQKLISSPKMAETGVLNNLINLYKTVGDLVNVIISILTFGSGILLLWSAVKPGLNNRIDLLSQFVSGHTLSIWHSISVWVGFMLIYMSFELFYKVKRAYKASILLLLLGAVSTFLKGLDYEEGLLMMGMVVVLHSVRPSFYRYSMPLRFGKFLIITAISLVAIVNFFLLNAQVYTKVMSHRLYPEAMYLNRETLLWHSFLVSVGFLVSMFIWYRSRAKLPSAKCEALEIERVRAHLQQHTGDALTHLYFLGDKQFYWAANGTVLFCYGQIRDLLVVLGDPIGVPENIKEAIQEFLNYIDEYGYSATFYEVTQQYMSIYHDFGYHFFKLGEEAMVNASEYQLSGASKSKQRHTLNQFTKNGYLLELVFPPHDQAIVAACKAISDDWLKGRSEMGFSLGYFDEVYLNTQPIAIFRNPVGDIEGFVSLMPSYNGESLSTDLMRFKADLPHGTMDFIMLNLIRQVPTLGLTKLSLGMAPLSNVGENRHAHLGERIANQVFKHGRFNYKFQGLRKFKEKFEPQWRPRYLAYPQLLSLPVILIEVSMLIARGKSKHQPE